MLQTAMKASRLIRIVHPNQPLRPILAGPTRHFSAEAQPPPNQSAASADPIFQTPVSPPNQQQSSASADPFFQTPDSGLFYGKLSGITKQTLKSDILRLLNSRNLGPDDLKINYNWRFEPTGVMIQFPSLNAYEAALRTVRRVDSYRLEKVDRSLWDNTRLYDGKFLLLQGIPREALPDDIDRLLSDCEYDSTSIQMIFRQDGFPNPVRMALVRFPNASLAMDAFITKNRSFCRNNRILMQVLH